MRSAEIEAREDTLRTLISISDDFDEADGYVEDHCVFCERISLGQIKEEKDSVKYKLIKELFNIGNLYDCGSEDDVSTNYEILLKALINTRWK